MSKFISNIPDRQARILIEGQIDRRVKDVVEENDQLKNEISRLKRLQISK